MQDLVRLNTPRAVETESGRALRQLNKGAMESAINNLVKLKGVGAATASGDDDVLLCVIWQAVYLKVAVELLVVFLINR